MPRYLINTISWFYLPLMSKTGLSSPTSHWMKKWSNFDLKSWVNGGTKIRPGIQSNWKVFESIWLKYSPITHNHIRPVTQLFRSKWLHFFFQCKRGARCLPDCLFSAFLRKAANECELFTGFRAREKISLFFVREFSCSFAALWFLYDFF